MTKAACHYAIVRFMPFAETEEFANVGVLLFTPRGRYFGFRLIGNRTGRITNFFEQVDTGTSRKVLRDLHEELERVSSVFKSLGTDRRFREIDVSGSLTVWQELLQPKESAIQFSEGRVILAEDPKAALSDLFGHYVERNFVTKEHRERLLEVGVYKLLRSAFISDRFSRARVGNDEYHVTFPFVELDGDAPLRVIKPLNLNQDDSAKIIDHGGQWAARIRNLAKRNLLPRDVLFAFDGDLTEDSVKGQARRDAVTDLLQLDVDVAPLSSTERVLQFAKGGSVPKFDSAL